MYHWFNVKKITHFAYRVYCVFCMDLKTNNDFYIINWFVFIIEMKRLLLGTHWILHKTHYVSSFMSKSHLIWHDSQFSIYYFYIVALWQLWDINPE
jgi:hypothetical protein